MKIWEVDPLVCRFCQGEMKTIIFINDGRLSKILKHLTPWDNFQTKQTPPQVDTPCQYELFADGRSLVPRLPGLILKNQENIATLTPNGGKYSCKIIFMVV